MVIDASVWISSLLTGDVNHTRTLTWLRRQIAATTSLFAPMLFLSEVSGGVVRRTGRPRLARRVLNDLLAAPTLRLVPVDEHLARSAADLAIELRLRGADALYVAVARDLGIPLVTWDREQRERAGAVVATFTPADQQN